MNLEHHKTVAKRAIGRLGCYHLLSLSEAGLRLRMLSAQCGYLCYGVYVTVCVCMYCGVCLHYMYLSLMPVSYLGFWPGYFGFNQFLILWDWFV